jgi:pyruvate,orthophosphate dikinase
MFFEGDRIKAMREMIVAADEAGRRRALAKLLPMQRADFEGIFEAMDGFPVTIRLLDPPLHEFLPHVGAEMAAVARALDIPLARLRRRVESLVETNPMLGHRGCRLGITYPEVTEMQARAIFLAACRVAARGKKVVVEVMVPLVAHVEELRRQAQIVRRVAQEVFLEEGLAVPFLVGTMIEVPRAALTQTRSPEADFFSFRTSDLTQILVYRGTTRGGSCRSTSRRASSPTIRSRSWTSRAWGSWWSSPCGSAGGRAPSSRWASAASTAASPRR